MLNVTIWGSRGSIPATGREYVRYGGATTCLEIELEGASGDTPSRVIVDCGTGMAELGRSWGERAPEALVLQTHMHWDHIQGFPFFGPLFNPKGAFEFWSVPREGSTFKQVMEGQMSGPMFPIGLDALPARKRFEDIEAIGQTRRGELELAWTELAHPSGSTAYRVTYRGVTLVFSGDVEVQEGTRDRLVDFAQGADALIMDAQYFPEEYPMRRGFGHSTPLDAVGVARDANVGQLLLTHHDPSHNDARLDAKLSVARDAAHEGLELDNARDLMRLEMRAHGIDRIMPQAMLAR